MTAMELARGGMQPDLMIGLTRLHETLVDAYPAVKHMSNQVHGDFMQIRDGLVQHGGKFATAMAVLYSDTEQPYRLKNTGILIEFYANSLWFARNQLEWSRRFLAELAKHGLVSGDSPQLKFKKKGGKAQWEIDEDKGGLSADFKKPMKEWYEVIKTMYFHIRGERKHLSDTIGEAVDGLGGLLEAVAAVPAMVEDAEIEAEHEITGDGLSLAESSEMMSLRDAVDLAEQLESIIDARLDLMHAYRRQTDITADVIEQKGDTKSLEEFMQFDQAAMRKALKPLAELMKADTFVDAYLSVNRMNELDPVPWSVGWLTDRSTFYKQLGLEEDEIGEEVKASLRAIVNSPDRVFAAAMQRLSLVTAAKDSGWHPAVAPTDMNLSRLDAMALESIDRIITLGGHIVAGADRQQPDYREQLLSLESTAMIRQHALNAMECIVTIRSSRHVTDDSAYMSPRFAEMLGPLASSREYDHMLLSDAVVKLREALAEMRRVQQS